MNYFVFPFEEVPKNSRVVLYAAGNVGKHYYKQVQETKHCEILFWLDQNADGKLVKKPEAIVNVNEGEYDLVVIAILNETAAKDAKTLLMNHGVPESKILHNVHTYELSEVQSKLDAHAFLNEPKAVNEALIKYFYESDGDLEYFSPLVEEIKQMLSSTDKSENDRVKEAFEEKALEIVKEKGLTVESKIVLLRVMFDARCFTKELMRELVRLVAEIKDNMPLKYWLLFELSYMWFLYPNILYEGFFVDKKELMRDYARELRLNWHPPIHDDKENRKICVLVNHLESVPPFCAVTQYVSPIVRALSDKGYKLHVIDMSPFRRDSGMGIMKPLPQFTTSVQKTSTREDVLQYYPEHIELHYVVNAMMKNRQQDILDMICRINPYCILDFSDEQAPISYYYSQSYPTVYIPLRKPGCSSSFFHKIIHITSDEAVFYPPITKEQVIALKPPFERKEPLCRFMRSDYGLADDDVVVITAGTRLNFEVSNELAEQMCNLLRSDRKVKWLCVGCGELPYIKKMHEDLIGKSVIFIKYENDLPGLYGICDIYLNPERVGGGTTIAWAMQQGLAVVSPTGAAAGVTLIGKENSLPDEDELIPQIMRLSKDNQFLLQKKELSREMAMEWSLERYINGIVNGMNQLATDFQSSLYGQEIL